MVIGLWQSLAGGAYLPLDPVIAQERLAFMLEDAQVSVLLTQAASGTSSTRAMVVCPDWKMLAYGQRTTVRKTPSVA